MKTTKLDFICNNCYSKHPHKPHSCIYTAVSGDTFTYPKTGRIGLSKDGLSCKYFHEKLNG